VERLDRLARILGDWREIVSRGAFQDPADLLRAHPDLADDLRAHFDAEALLTVWFRTQRGRSGAPPSGAPAPDARVEDSVTALQAAWDHRWESLGTALQGVTEEEAAHQAECYRGEPAEEGWPPPGTILWQVAHVAHSKRYYAALLERRGATERPEPEPRRPLRTLAEETAALAEAHEVQRASVRALREADLALALPNGMTVAELLAHQTRHDVWHAAQIVVARRLWRTRRGGSSGA
jgi:hypothetical protein